VFRGIEYRIAAPLSDYAGAFSRAVEQAGIESVFACNCILNYLYGELEGRKTGDVAGPITFGEIAYQLLNQTMVYLSVRPMPTNPSRYVAQVAVPAVPVVPAAPVAPVVPAASQDPHFLQRLGHAMSGLFGRR
jgi:hypothetical protein